MISDQLIRAEHDILENDPFPDDIEMTGVELRQYNNDESMMACPSSLASDSVTEVPVDPIAAPLANEPSETCVNNAKTSPISPYLLAVSKSEELVRFVHPVATNLCKSR